MLLFLAPAALLAQDELTVESLAETVAGFTEWVVAFEAKLEPVTKKDGLCIQYSDDHFPRLYQIEIGLYISPDFRSLRVFDRINPAQEGRLQLGPLRIE